MILAVLTASTNPTRAKRCIESWRDTALNRNLVVHVLINGAPYLGTVPAFRQGMQEILLMSGADVIACLHDDFEIEESRWDEKVLRHFERHPECGLAGFGGAVGLGTDDLYKAPYDPMQLARIGFRSNLIDAEAHGLRSLLPERVACLDGFSQVGRRDFWEGFQRQVDKRIRYQVDDAPWTMLGKLGMVHHWYDGALGALAARYGWDTWYLPLRGKHHGGQTAVGDAGYGEWAKTQVEGGDQGFWQAAHRLGYDEFRDVLPLRV